MSGCRINSVRGDRVGRPPGQGFRVARRPLRFDLPAGMRLRLCPCLYLARAPNSASMIGSAPTGRIVSHPIGSGDATTEREADGEDRRVEPTSLFIQWVMGSSYGARHRLLGARLAIGRADDCHIRLEHPSVSRRHAEIYRQGLIHAVKDRAGARRARRAHRAHARCGVDSEQTPCVRSRALWNR